MILVGGKSPVALSSVGTLSDGKTPVGTSGETDSSPEVAAGGALSVVVKTTVTLPEGPSIEDDPGAVPEVNTIDASVGTVKTVETTS